eukprot:1155635-Pelagomonas_calceolata.AAC.11
MSQQCCCQWCWHQCCSQHASVECVCDTHDHVALYDVAVSAVGINAATLKQQCCSQHAPVECVCDTHGHVAPPLPNFQYAPVKCASQAQFAAQYQ